MKKIIHVWYGLSFVSFIAAQSNDFYVLHARPCGLFSCYLSVIGLLDFYEKNPCAGIAVKYDSGFYLDALVGSNWWNYFFQPIYFGSAKKARSIDIPFQQNADFAGGITVEISKQRAHELIKKYIHLKRHIQQQIDAFVKQHFKGFYVIGVHYRGTDKNSESVRVSYEAVLHAIKQRLNKLPRNKLYKIFVATDEQALIAFLEHNLQHMIYRDVYRSQDGTPIHYGHFPAGYRQGEATVIDCMLLSRCNCLIRTSSNLSLVATLINPDLPVTLVS